MLNRKLTTLLSGKDKGKEKTHQKRSTGNAFRSDDANAAAADFAEHQRYVQNLDETRLNEEFEKMLVRKSSHYERYIEDHLFRSRTKYEVQIVEEVKLGLI